jgi:glycosyltransferase involved in cell wall biosynthesis
MNLLYISNEYPPETGNGGIGTYTKYCAEGMAARGHNVYVICRSESGERSITTICGVIVYRTMPGFYPLPSHRIFFPLRNLCYHAIPDSLIRLAWAKQAYETYKNEIVSKGAIDIVEYPECGGEGFYFSNERGLSKVARLHTPWEMVRKLDNIMQLPLDRILLSYLERSAVRRASLITSPTHALAGILKKRWNLSEVIVIPNPIFHCSYSLTEGTDLLFLGRIEYRKGVHILIEAYRQLCNHLTPPLLRLVGSAYGKLPDGTDYGDHIARLIATIPDNGSIEWVRGVKHPCVIDYIRRSSIALFPSLWENMSYSCLEAMASGLAVVASNCGGFPEMITHGETGLLVEAQSAEALMEAVKKLIVSPQLTKKIGNNAQLHVRKHFGAESVCPRIETMYKGLLQRRSHGKK